MCQIKEETADAFEDGTESVLDREVLPKKNILTMIRNTAERFVSAIHVKLKAERCRKWAVRDRTIFIPETDGWGEQNRFEQSV